MASLGHFISKFGERALPFFKIMKRTGTFKWTPEVDKAFEELKIYLASAPVMVAPRADEPLKLYLSATPQTASAVLVVERDEPVLPKKHATAPRPRPPDEAAASPGPQPEPPLPAEPATTTPVENSPQAGLSRDTGEPPEEPTAATPQTTLVEHPVYFVSTVLRDARERYPMQQKLLLALLIASRKL